MATVTETTTKRRIKIKIVSRKFETEPRSEACDNSKKRGPPGVVDSQKKKRQKMDRSVKLQCGSILQWLMDHPDSRAFKKPVDPLALKIPHYLSIITTPMDLGTVKAKLEDGLYYRAEEFTEDVGLIFSNAMMYNPQSNYFHKMAKKLDTMFRNKWKSLEAKLKLERKNQEKKPNACPKILPVRVADVSLDARLAKAKPAKTVLASKCPVGKDSHKGTVSGKESTCFDAAFSSKEPPEQDCGTRNVYPDVDVQLSPKKALRAAMLRNHFAGAISKAQMTVDHVYKADPVKHRQEKERLERQQQKDKARIEAEVRAVDVASKLRAQEELRMQQERERERQAARIALEEVEKSVEIEDNLKILKELFTVAEGYEVFLGASEEDCHLKNPLELLGLFIKDDDDYKSDDEEEGEILW